MNVQARLTSQQSLAPTMQAQQMLFGTFKSYWIVEFWGLPPLIPLLQCVNRLGFEICPVNSCQSEQGSLVTLI